MFLRHVDLTSRIASRLAVSGLALVLVAFAVVAVGGALETQRATEAARKALTLNEVYFAARNAVVNQESLE
ncbi:MAG: hypothetical protein QOJ55_1375, partial [Solirubrobacteraceae bacterium]|nr:hypothetical protein [Solirubrobacteraceae bacterium]